MKRLFVRLSVAFAMAIAAVASALAAGDPRVENVRARQIPDTKDVEVVYDLIAPDGGLFNISAAFQAPGVTPAVKTVTGDFGSCISPGRNRRFVWNAGVDWPDNVNSNFVCTVNAKEQEMDMVRIPGGTNAGTLYPEGYSYSLTVATFWMDRTEVTYAKWKRVYSWAVNHGYQFDYQGSGKGDEHPVHTISWYDAIKWCNARSEMDGFKPAYRLTNGAVFRTGKTYSQCDFRSGGYRLPTVDEWEYAARGGLVGRRYPWGDTISHSQANYFAGGDFSDASNYGGYNPMFCVDGVEPYTAPVASFAPNGYGLYDMVGNVWELCTDEFGNQYDRGGSWYSFGGCRLDYNYSGGYINASNYIGFRVVRR